MLRWFVLIQLLGLTSALQAHARDTYTFLHISDTHVTGSRNAAALREFADQLGSAQHAFVICTGDVTELGTEEEYAAYRVAVARAQTPVYAVPGNHDVRWAPTGKEGFRKACGPLYRSFDYGGCHFVLLDSTVALEHWGHIDGEQLAWLKQDLRRLKRDVPVFVFLHHWLGRERTNIDNAGELLEILAPYNVVGMFMGHGHSDLAWEVNGIRCFMVRGLYQGSHHEVSVRGREAVVTLVRTDQANATRQVIATMPLIPSTRTRIVFEWDDPDKPVLARRRFRARLTAIGQPSSASESSKVSWALDGIEQGEASCLRASSAWSGAEFDASALSPGWHTLTLKAQTRVGQALSKEIPFLVERPDGSVRTVWEYATGSTIQGSPSVRDDTVYVGSFDHSVYALDAVSGRRRWRHATGGAVFATPCVTDDTVFVGSMDGNLYAIDRRSGRRRWKFNAECPILASPAVLDGIVCVGINRAIIGIDQTSGKEAWRLPTGSFFQSRAAISDRHFILGGWDNTLYAIEARTGREAWSVKMGRTERGTGRLSFYYSPAITSPAVGDGRVYVCTNDGTLHALDIQSGVETWTARAPSGGDTFGYSSPLYANGRVYLGGLGEKGQGDCYALDAASGKLIWRCSTGADNYDSSPALTGGLVAIGSVSGRITWIDPNTGKVRAAYQIRPGYSFTSPTGSGERTYTASMNGRASALSTPPMEHDPKEADR